MTPAELLKQRGRKLRIFGAACALIFLVTMVIYPDSPLPWLVMLASCIAIPAYGVHLAGTPTPGPHE